MIVESNLVWVDKFVPRTVTFDHSIFQLLVMDSTEALFVRVCDLIVGLLLYAFKLRYVDIGARCCHLKPLEQLLGPINHGLPLVVLEDLALCICIVDSICDIRIYVL